MSRVQTLTVAPSEGEQRLDRWFRQHFPGLTQGSLQRLLRTGQVRVDGKRVKAGDRLAAGQRVRVPPLPSTPAAAPRPASARPADDPAAQALRARVLHRDDAVLVIDKPAGLAVQGGSKQHRHLDGMLDALRFDGAERPRLVHRLDKDTAGVLVLARDQRAARFLTGAFREKTATKIYWALTVGVPKPSEGTIEQKLAKRPSRGGERVVAGDEGKRAVTRYAVVETAAQRLGWLALMPVTGRTHQLRVHCAALGTPIIGDGKYGGASAHGTGLPSHQLQLFARELTIAHPNGGRLRVVADLPPHMVENWQFLGFALSDYEDPFQ